MKDTHCDLDVAVSWSVVSAKNALKNLHRFSPNQFVFRKNPNFLNVDNNLLAASEGSTTSKIVADNLNAMHYERQQYTKSESSEKIARALRSQTRTYSDTK